MIDRQNAVGKILLNLPHPSCEPIARKLVANGPVNDALSQLTEGEHTEKGPLRIEAFKEGEDSWMTSAPW